MDSKNYAWLSGNGGWPKATVTGSGDDMILKFTTAGELVQATLFDRQTLTQISTVGMRGPKPGDFDIVHHMATDSKGNLYTAEIVTNRRAQRFVIQNAR